MNKHPFRIAIENHAGEEAFAKLFSPDVVLRAPMLTKPVVGVTQVLDVISHAATIAGPIRYTVEVNDTKQTVLLWNGRVEGHTPEAATILVDGEGGLICEVRVLMRPWPITKIFRDQMFKELSSKLPQDYWELGPKPNSVKPRVFTSIALKPIELAPDMVLHSPILAKSVSGKALVDGSLKLAHEVQSPSSYTSIIATPDLLIEIFDCDADGYPMEGLWLQKLNSQGQIYDLTVMLRPFPAVTVLRNRAKDLAEKRGFLADEYWNLAKAVQQL